MQFFPLPHTTPFFFGGSPLDTNDNYYYDESRRGNRTRFWGEKIPPHTHALFYVCRESKPPFRGKGFHTTAVSERRASICRFRLKTN